MTSINCPLQRLLGEGLIRSATVSPSKTALVVEGSEYSYEQLFEAASSLANGLRARGLDSGDRVAIYMENGWECAVSIYATILAGGVFVVINPQTKSDKLGFVLRDSDAKVLLTEIGLETQFVPAIAEASTPANVICVGGEKSGVSTRVSIETFDHVIGNTSSVFQPPPSIALDLAALIYTSGSTGNPKGVMHTHQTMVFALHSLIEYLRLESEHIFVNILPLAFDYGLYQLLMSIQLGATLLLEKSFVYPAPVLKRISDYQVSVFPGVPTIYAMLISSHRRKQFSLPYVQRVTNTAAALPADYNQPLMEIFPNALIYRMYGLTECKRVCYLEPELVNKKPMSVGKAIPGTEVFLLSPEGKAVKPGEAGILHVRGPHVMLGYWKQEELSRRMLVPGKFPGERILCTHDWFRADEDGHLYFVGRSDDIIKTRGEKVSPVEVENVLYHISGIREAAVVGVPDATLGQAIAVYVSLEPGADVDQKLIKKTLAEKLENFMLPKYISILEDLPKTGNGKIDRKYLAEQSPNVA